MRGHVRKRGSTYSFVIDIGYDEDGKRKQKWHSGYKTKKEAEKALNEMLVKVEKGEHFITDNMLFKEYLNKWLKEYAKPKLVVKTFNTYVKLIDYYIVPRLGDIELAKLKPLNLQSFYTYLQNELNLSGTTALHCHNIISTSLKHAVKWQLLNTNIADSVERPKRSKPEMQVLDDSQTNWFLENIKTSSLYMTVLLALTTGMRRSEILGLTWDNVDLEKGVIYVHRQLQNVNGTLQLVPLKTKSSNRTISLLDFTLPILKEERQKQAESSRALGSLYINNNFVCCQGDGRPYDPDYISRHFLKKLTLFNKRHRFPKIRFHDLRHTHATLLLKQGVNPKIVQERLGHSSIKITLDTYSHVLPDMQKEAAQKLNSLFSHN